MFSKTLQQNVIYFSCVHVNVIPLRACVLFVLCVCMLSYLKLVSFATKNVPNFIYHFEHRLLWNCCGLLQDRLSSISRPQKDKGRFGAWLKLDCWSSSSACTKINRQVQMNGHACVLTMATGRMQQHLWRHIWRQIIQGIVSMVETQFYTTADQEYFAAGKFCGSVPPKSLPL